MSNFIIQKTTTGNFYHIYNNARTKVNVSDFDVVLDDVALTFIIQCKNGSNIPSQAVSISLIQVIDLSVGTSPIPFSGIDELILLLKSISYTPYLQSLIITEPIRIYEVGQVGVFTMTPTQFTDNFTENGLGRNTMLGWALRNDNNGTKNQQGKFSLNKGASPYDVIGAIGGEAKHTLISSELPQLVATVATTGGGTGGSDDQPARGTGGESVVNYPITFTQPEFGLGHNNMPPYLIDVWVERVTELVFYGASGGSGGAVNSVNGQTGDVYIPLDYLPLAGGAMDADADIFFDNGSKISEGIVDAGTGGNKGIALTCSVGYEWKFEAGEAYLTNLSGNFIDVKQYARAIPLPTDDITKGFVSGSNWYTLDGTQYICTDPTTGAAVWELVVNIPNLGQVLEQQDRVFLQTSEADYTISENDFNKWILVINPTNRIILNDDANTFKEYCSVPFFIQNDVVEFKLSSGTTDLRSNLLPNIDIPLGTDSLTLYRGDYCELKKLQNYPIWFFQVDRNTTKTSDLTNDGADGINPFITALDIPPSTNGLPTGGTAGQILTKVDATDYNATWQENYADWTSVVKHTVKNDGTGLITKGTAVYVTGSNGTNMLVGKASNTSEATSSKTMGLMQSDITTTGGTQTGFVITEGLLSGLNTAGQTAGDPVWLGVNGALIYGLANKPYAPAHLVFIGIVTKVSAGNGEIFVKPQNGFELKEIHDVDLITNAPTNNQALTFETSNGLWKNKTIIEDLIVNGVTDKAPSQNAVFDALALKQNSSTLIFDSIQKAIMRDNYFWFTPSLITAGAGGYTFATSERISGNSFAYLNNGALVRGMLSFNTTAIAGTLAHSRRNDSLILTGLEVVFTRKIQFNSNVSGQRFFTGISKGNQFSVPTNVEPNTLTDIVGVCQLSTSTNMHVVHNDASGTATTIDLGSSYPCNDSQYNYYITVEQTTTTYIVSVERVTIATGASISTTNTLSSNIPNYATGIIQLIAWISNNASAAIASYLDGGAIGNVKNQ
jgi:hypothetical protein